MVHIVRVLKSVVNSSDQDRVDELGKYFEEISSDFEKGISVQTISTKSDFPPERSGVLSLGNPSLGRSRRLWRSPGVISPVISSDLRSALEKSGDGSPSWRIQLSW